MKWYFKGMTLAAALIVSMAGKQALAAAVSCDHIRSGINCGANYVMGDGACATAAQVADWDAHCAGQTHTVAEYCPGTYSTDAANQPRSCTCATGYAYSTSTYSCSSCASGYVDPKGDGTCVAEVSVVYDAAGFNYYAEAGDGTGFWDILGSSVFGDLSYHLAGTVTVNNGSANVAGTDTFFTLEIAPGDAIKITDGTHSTIFTVKTVSSDTALVLDTTSNRNYAGADSYKDRSLITFGTGKLQNRLSFSMNALNLNMATSGVDSPALQFTARRTTGDYNYGKIYMHQSSDPTMVFSVSDSTGATMTPVAGLTDDAFAVSGEMQSWGIRNIMGVWMQQVYVISDDDYTVDSRTSGSISITDHTIAWSSLTVDRFVTIPAAACNSNADVGRELVFGLHFANNTQKLVSITATGGTINGSSDALIVSAPYQHATIYCGAATKWFIRSSH
jgi:hypothetical protein